MKQRFLNLLNFITDRWGAVARVRYADGEVRYFDQFKWDCFGEGIERMEKQNTVKVKRYDKMAKVPVLAQEKK